MAGRENADLILEKIKKEDSRKGRLKIFFGYAAGVGKTYAMLKAAHRAKEQGTDVVAGYIEPHARPETMRLAQGLETLKPLAVSYKSITLNEFDLDAALARKPELILVDELAHTNAEGLRHVKRYQDIEELLRAGIDVYTTVNVQHIESLCDIVASISGTIVRERIPDRVFDEADQVELVDIEPAELMKRLGQGKIYKRDRAEKALENFFTEDNLTSLREIALRRAADRVNRLAEKTKRPAEGGYTDEHILVGLSSSPSNPKIIRTAARMAAAFKGNFTAIFVQTTSYDDMSEEDKKRLEENTHLAERLGANIETAFGDDIAFQIAEFAKYSGVSKIVIGRSNTKRKFMRTKQSFAEKLTAFAPRLDIYIIPDAQIQKYTPKDSDKKIIPSAGDVLKTAGILAAATVLGWIFWSLGFSEANIITVYILGVLITSATVGDRICSIVSSVLSVIVFNYFFTDPRFTLSAYDSGYPVTFVIMFIAAFISGNLAVKIKIQAKQSAAVAYRTKLLLETNRILQQAKSAGEIAEAAAGQLVKLLGKPVVFYLAGSKGLEEPMVFTGGGVDTGVYVTDNERAVAQWVFKNNKHAGATTNTLGNAECLYLAVRSSGEVFGVIGIAVKDGAPDAFENNLILSIVGECALALGKEEYSRKREEAAAQAKNEKLRANLLRSISHDLRTPLTSISGNAAILISNNLAGDKKVKLYNDIYDDSMWLINLVENLLSVTRIEDGTMNINMQAEVVDEVIDEAMKHINRHSSEHIVEIKGSDDMLLALMDARLIIQVIINIVDNAVKYTPVGSHITLSSRKRGGFVEITIADNGGGISDEAKKRVFDMFYRADSSAADSRRGMGLGLALCKSIITAHGGAITVGDNKPHGTVFKFTLRAEEVNLHE